MSNLKKPLFGPMFVDDDACHEPESTVRVRTRRTDSEEEQSEEQKQDIPLIDLRTNAVAADCRAGRLTQEEALEKVIALNIEQASAYLSAEEQLRLEAYLRSVAANNPEILSPHGREK